MCCNGSIISHSRYLVIKLFAASSGGGSSAGHVSIIMLQKSSARWAFCAEDLYKTGISRYSFTDGNYCLSAIYKDNAFVSKKVRLCRKLCRRFGWQESKGACCFDGFAGLMIPISMRQKLCKIGYGAIRRWRERAYQPADQWPVWFLRVPFACWSCGKDGCFCWGNGFLWFAICRYYLSGMVMSRRSKISLVKQI